MEIREKPSIPGIGETVEMKPPDAGEGFKIRGGTFQDALRVRFGMQQLLKGLKRRLLFTRIDQTGKTTRGVVKEVDEMVETTKSK